MADEAKPMRPVHRLDSFVEGLMAVSACVAVWTLRKHDVAPWMLSIPVFMALVGVLSVKLGFGKYARIGASLLLGFGLLWLWLNVGSRVGFLTALGALGLAGASGLADFMTAWKTGVPWLPTEGRGVWAYLAISESLILGVACWLLIERLS